MSDSNLPVSAETDEHHIEPAHDAYLRASENIIAAINASLPPNSTLLKPIPTDVVLRRGDAEAAQAMVHSVAQMLGGAQGFLAWAIDHRDEFYTVIYPKLLKSDQQTAFTGGNITIVTPIPATPADLVTLNEGGKASQVIDHDDLLDDDDLADDEDDE